MNWYVSRKKYVVSPYDVIDIDVQRLNDDDQHDGSDIITMGVRRGLHPTEGSTINVYGFDKENNPLVKIGDSRTSGAILRSGPRVLFTGTRFRVVHVLES